MILISDFHLLKTNPVCRTDNVAQIHQFEKFEYLCQKSIEYDMPIISAGDQTDVSRDFDLFEKMRNILDNYQPKMYCVLGQHDMYLRTEKASIMSLLIDMGYIKRLNQIPVKIDGFNVYGCSYCDEFVPVPETKNNILVIHAEITTEKLAQKNMNFIDAKDFLLANSKYKMILCGDIHKRFIYEEDNRIICNTGPIIRKDASEYFLKYKPKFFIYKNGEITKKTIPHNKNVISRKHLEQVKENENMRNFSLEVGTGVEELFDFKIEDILDRLIKTNKINHKTREIIFNYEGDLD